MMIRDAYTVWLSLGAMYFFMVLKFLLFNDVSATKSAALPPMEILPVNRWAPLDQSTHCFPKSLPLKKHVTPFSHPSYQNFRIYPVISFETMTYIQIRVPVIPKYSMIRSHSTFELACSSLLDRARQRYHAMHTALLYKTNV